MHERSGDRWPLSVRRASHARGRSAAQEPSIESKHRAPQRTPPKHESERAAACVDAKADAAAAASVTPTRAISCTRAEHRVSIEHHSVRRPSMRASEQRSIKHHAPQRTPPKHESERAAACVDAKADAAAAASVTPTRAISCTRAEHRVSIEHHSVRRPSMRASEQRRVSMLKLTQPQRRASHPHKAISCARAEHRVSIEHQRTPPKHASEQASSTSVRRPSMRASESSGVCRCKS